MFSEYIINQISEHTKLATVTQIQLECLYASWKELGNVPTSMTPIGEIVNETDITTWKRVQIVKNKKTTNGRDLRNLHRALIGNKLKDHYAYNGLCDFVKHVDDLGDIVTTISAV
ncbi:hypothetical protein EhV198 [Emiliania huxleyi virus 86]|uniref:Uncharacterized protein n=1 Tax=Emiliania huxleyi virus 86 (isolate United Kingdom/English Channel/1999) TaxID=654925 RepID=Q4A2T5_EHV8U|nr:hypothetical protein EhV198 [Emiliania huxleyi virus 86]CAI65621.1 hypothetical protein EhV198 [Emiliania huxleyi virus 86]CAZ69526.1 hypothetical protein [Emiliania huxleyi virus 99B1]|mmetsp:Transcript_23271/g.66687  ORF Transcript_23271/g.66687 Transcript_23271/m.66687 type:complete len:115 (-) Transcript_23271:1846-2190(-)